MTRADLTQASLKDFFAQDWEGAMERRFVDALQLDFNQVVTLFRDHVCRQPGQDQQLGIKFLEALPHIINEICAIKVQLVRAHSAMLLESAVEAEKADTAMIREKMNGEINQRG